jgi:hypothetical protein
MSVIDKSVDVLDEDEQEEAARVAYARAVGARLRTMRKQMRLSLQAVEAMSDDATMTRWGASGTTEEIVTTSARRANLTASGTEKVAIDLTKLHTVSGPERDLLRRFLSMIQVHRQDFNGRMITIRAEDVRAIACLFGVTPDSMGTRLDELGLLVTV